MDVFNVIDKLTACESMCNLILKNATEAAKKEVCGRASGRTLEELVLAIHGICQETAEALHVQYHGNNNSADFYKKEN